MTVIDLAGTVAREPFFEVLETTPRGQVAVMCLKKGQASGPGMNVHDGRDQWLYVLGGHGLLKTGEAETALAPGSLVRIAPGEPHQVVGASDETFVTLEFYSPPAY